jgi:hypothetical protein
MGATHAAVFEVAEQARSFVPGLTIWFDGDAEVDCTLRIGEPVLSACTAIALPWPEETMRDITVVLGSGQETSHACDILIGARLGEERTVKRDLEGWAGTVFSVTAKGGEREAAVRVDETHAPGLGDPGPPASCDAPHAAGRPDTAPGSDLPSAMA